MESKNLHCVRWCHLDNFKEYLSGHPVAEINDITPTIVITNKLMRFPLYNIYHNENKKK